MNTRDIGIYLVKDTRNIGIYLFKNILIKSHCLHAAPKQLREQRISRCKQYSKRKKKLVEVGTGCTFMSDLTTTVLCLNGMYESAAG